jgi:hypothetical protein
MSLGATMTTILLNMVISLRMRGSSKGLGMM